MKKLIAISVVFALVAGAVFAADIGVDIWSNVDLIKGDTGKDKGVTDGTLTGISTATTAAHKPKAGGATGQFRISASGENDDGTFGAFFRYDAWGWNATVGSAQGHAWWKPVDALKILIGGGPDGRFEQSGVTRWNFYQVANDHVTKENWKFGSSFYQGWEDVGLDLIITPVEPLEINFAIPFISKGGNVQDVYMKSTLQVAYNIENIGKFAITYASDVGNKAKVDATLYEMKDEEKGDVYWLNSKTGKIELNPNDPGYSKKSVWVPLNEEPAVNDTGKLWLYFNLTAIENLSIDIGFGYQLPKSYTGYSYNYPIYAGVGAKFDAGDFGVKARVQGSFAGSAKVEGSPAYSVPINVVFDVMPYYAVSEALAINFSVGVDYTMKSNNEVDKDSPSNYAKVGFHVNPYITIKSSWWAPNFYAGVLVYTDGTKYSYDANTKVKDGSTVINWSVPMGISFSF